MTSTPTHPAALGAPAARRSWLDRHSLTAFLLLAYGWTAGLIGAAMLGIAAGLISEESPLVALAANLAPFGPALAAVVVVAATAGRAGLGRLLGSLDPRRVRPGWYILALFGAPLAIMLGATLAYGATPLTALVTQWPLLFTRYLPYTLTIALIGTGLAEELGWRGFAQPLLQGRYGPVGASLAVGAAAALWHAPNLVAGPGGMELFALLSLYTVVVAPTFAWAYNRNRGSALIVALLHAALNTSSRLLSGFVPIGDLGQFQLNAYWIAVVVAGIASALVVLLTRGRLGAPGGEPRDQG